MNLPQELTITEDDLAGDYTDIFNCPLARALKRAGVNMGGSDGYHVAGQGHVRQSFFKQGHEGDGFYVWDTGEEFNCTTLKAGRLVYKHAKTYSNIG